MTRGHKSPVMMEKQTNKLDEIKWLKYAQHLITDANCFRVGGEGGCGGERCTWGRGRGTWEYPPCAFGLRLTSELSPLSREGQHQVQLFTSAACENTLNTKDYTAVRCNIAWPLLLFTTTPHGTFQTTIQWCIFNTNVKTKYLLQYSLTTLEHVLKLQSSKSAKMLFLTTPAKI